MDVVSFETAKRLKEAGFPQPDPDFGQTWYEEDGVLVIVIEAFYHPLAHYAWVIERRGSSVLSRDRSMFDRMCYAPGPADLLRHLPDLPILYSNYGTFDTVGDFRCDKSLPELLAKCWFEK